MRAFEITHPRYTGHVSALYNEKGLLSVLTLRDATFQSAAELQVFKTKIPAQIEDFLSGQWAQGAVWLETVYEIPYSLFWDTYKKKVNNLVCEKLWGKLSMVDRGKAVYAISSYDDYLERTGYRKKADPETYLRQRYWDTDWRSLKE